MHKKDQQKVKVMIEKLQSIHDEIESLFKSENDRLSKMTYRQCILGNKRDIIERDTIAMDSARLSITDAIIDLSKVFEKLS